MFMGSGWLTETVLFNTFYLAWSRSDRASRAVPPQPAPGLGAWWSVASGRREWKCTRFDTKNEGPDSYRYPGLHFSAGRRRALTPLRVGRVNVARCSPGESGATQAWQHVAVGEMFVTLRGEP
jgi:hypothetical protein